MISQSSFVASTDRGFKYAYLKSLIGQKEQRQNPLEESDVAYSPTSQECTYEQCTICVLDGSTHYQSLIAALQTKGWGRVIVSVRGVYIPLVTEILIRIAPIVSAQTMNGVSKPPRFGPRAYLSPGRNGIGNWNWSYAPGAAVSLTWKWAQSVIKFPGYG